MNHAYSTVVTQHDSPVARGVLRAYDPSKLVLEVPGTNYQLHLAVTRTVSTPVGKNVSGRIVARARRIDVVKTGGRCIDPVYGRPRRLQGNVIEVDPAAQTVTVNATVPFVCKVMHTQKAEQFNVGDFVSFDIEPGATFLPEAG